MGWIPGIGLVWDLIVTMTASYQKIFSDDPKIGYFEQASVYRAASDAGDLLPPATNAEQMQQIITNSTLNGTLQSIFAVLTIIVVLNALLDHRAHPPSRRRGAHDRGAQAVESELVAS